MTKMISLKDAASLLGVKPGTLQDWVARKDIICYRYPRPTSRPRFKPEDIEAYLKGSCVAARARLREAGR